MKNDTIHAYSELYLKDMIKKHAYLFELFERNQKHTTFSLIDSYMRYSSIRQKMDKANWSALNKSSKQMYNDVPLCECEEKNTEEKYDRIVLGWMANIYVRLQWFYNIPSSFISQHLSAEKLYKTYNPLHEASYDIACEKLYHKYLEFPEREVLK